MRSMPTAAVIVTTLAIPAAAHASSVNTLHTSHYRERVARIRAHVDHTFGHQAGGRDILRHGIIRHGHARPAPARVVVRYVAVLRRMIAPPRAAQLLHPTRPYVPPAGSSTIRATGAPLAAIRQCESGGNYSTDTGNGFAGAYQFTQSTWESVGGTGNPAAASPAEQDKRAAILYARRGAQPWPKCGR